MFFETQAELKGIWDSDVFNVIAVRLASPPSITAYSQSESVLMKYIYFGRKDLACKISYRAVDRSISNYFIKVVNAFVHSIIVINIVILLLTQFKSQQMY